MSRSARESSDTSAPVATARENSSRLSGDLQPITEEISARAGEIADGIGVRVFAAVPALVERGDSILTDAARNAIEATVGSILSMLKYGISGAASEPPQAVLDQFEMCAEDDDGLEIVLHMHRVAIAELWQRWAEALHAAALAPDEEHELLVASTGLMFTYLDRVSQELTDRWRETHRRRQRGLDVAPGELIRRALFGEAGEEEGLLQLDYDPARIHVALALPASLEEEELDRLAQRTRMELHAHSVRMGFKDGWVLWLGLERIPDEEVVSRIEERFSLEDPVGRGSAAEGVEGFRTTHREAVDAQRVALLRRSSGVTRYRDVALLAVLCADTVRARALVCSELGPLAVNDEVTSRLRETLTAYLACGESHLAASRELFVHQKTVSYRVRQAEKLLGRKVSERRSELEAALLLHRAFDGDV
ncbi:MAG: PucR family transcriptional regulator [Solirubrobacterales bacterium]